MKQAIVCCAAVLLVALALVGCAASSTQGPMAWLDEPLDGAALPLEPTELMAHASDADGVASFEFYVNGALLVRSPAAGGMLADATVGWNPSAPGVYTITARATDNQGNVGPEATAVVTVGELEGSPTPLPTARPTEEIVTQETPSPRPPSSPGPTMTPRQPTPRPTSAPPTATPRLPTATPRPPTPTPQPPARRPEIAYFQADPGTINAGGCSTLSWGVDYAAAVYLDGEGVGDHDTRQVCPATTTTYTLHATSGGGDDQDTATVTVIQAPTPTPIEDNTPPSISDISFSETEISTTIGCTAPPDTTVISARVWDESGVWAVIATLQLSGSPAGTVVMTQSAPDVYEVELGPFTQPGNLQITIMAQDFHANTAQEVRTVIVKNVCVM